MNNPFIFNMIYALAARDGREAALFGQSMPLAQKAFARSMACDEFPEVWFEIPLSGEPWFDLHLLASRESLHPNMAFSADNTGGYPDVFAWFAKQDGVRQLALSWDTGKGDIETPAVQVLVYRSDPQISCAFLHAAGRDDAQDAYRAFVERIPDEWFACYTGTFPNRERDFVRVECIVGRKLQSAYAENPALAASHLRQAGVRELGETAIPRCQALARSPFPLEFQFDVMPDGSLGPTFGASVRFALSSKEDGWPSFDSAGAAGDLMGQVEAWGLADERWHLLADTAFAKRVSRENKGFMVFNSPTFVKLRWHDGNPLDAKAYLLAGVQNASPSEQ